MWTDMKQKILSLIDPSCPYRGSLHYYDTLQSTNTLAKEMAHGGAPHGTVVIAGSQTGGRGRMGRTFCSPEGNLYLSMLLHTRCSPGQLMHLTCWAGVMACDAVESLTGIRPGIKWINDLMYRGKKLGGILTELVLDPKTGLADYAVVGIGINCRNVPPEVAEIAVCLKDMSAEDSPAAMAAALCRALWQGDWHALPQRYRDDCVTLGKQVLVAQTGKTGTALAVTDQGALWVEYPDGTREAVSSGEVSVKLL